MLISPVVECVYHLIYCFNCNCCRDFFLSFVSISLFWREWLTSADSMALIVFVCAIIIFPFAYHRNALRFGFCWMEDFLMMSDLFHLVAIFIQNKPIIRLETISYSFILLLHFGLARLRRQFFLPNFILPFGRFLIQIIWFSKLSLNALF